MAFKYIAVQGMTVEVDQTSPIPPGNVVATIVVSAPTQSTCSAGGALMHRDGDQITVTNITVPSAGATIADPGPYTSNMDVQGWGNVKSENLPVLREDDISVVIGAIPKIPGPPDIPYPVTFECIVTAAGQTKVRAQ
jgi:hypothetical protein